MRTRKSTKAHLRNTIALALLSSFAATGSAFAQDAEDAATEDGEVVIVTAPTGSRIRTEFNSPSPVQIIQTDSAEAAGVTDLSEVLQNSSIAAGSLQIDATLSSAFVFEGGPGVQSISLRGLGANRTLVLLNGRRAGPAGTRGQVAAFDLNVLPLSMVDRVEILKDGASSIYGSDAVAGVVNIITNQNMDGGTANLTYSQPEAGDGEEISADVAWGTRFDRGYFNFSVDYYRRHDTKRGTRDYTNCSPDYTFDAVTGERNDAIDPRTGAFACRGNTSIGTVWLYDYSPDGQLEPGANYIQYDPSGQIGALAPETIIPTPLSPEGPTAPPNWFNVNQGFDTSGFLDLNGNYEQNSSLIPNIERTTFYAEAGYEIADGVEAYAEVLLNRRRSSVNAYRQVWTYLYTYDYSYDSYDPFSVGWTGHANISPTTVTDHADSSEIVDYARIIAGVKGDFTGWMGDIDWDIYIQNSESDGEYSSDQILADAVYSSDGRSDGGTFGLFNLNSIPRPTASCVGYNTPVSDRPCVDVNWLSPSLLAGNGFTAEEEAFLYGVETGHTTYTQRFIEGSLSGDVFALPAGNAAAAVGFVYRTDEIKDVPGAISLAGNAWNSSSAGITEGDDTTTELFGELYVPIVADAPFAESLDLILSGRYTDVDSYGDSTTYKLGLSWQITPEFLVRATHGTSFRAPALYELYLASQTAFGRQTSIDPCIEWQDNLDQENISQRLADNCAADGIPGDYTGAGSGVTIVASGGAGLLEAETSEASVIGFVWSPRFIDLNVSLDYFEIEVEDEVDRLGPVSIVFNCYDSENFASEPLCGLFTRGNGNSPYLINTINDSYLNVNSQTNRGIDLTARYEHSFPLGELYVQGQFTYQLEDTVALFAGTEDDDNGINGDPEWVGNIDIRFAHNDWTFFWRADLIGPTSDDSIISNLSSNGSTRYDLDGEFTAYHAVSVEREFDSWSVLLGVANVFDEEPPSVSTTSAAAQSFVGPSLLSSQYDYVGRRVYARVSKSF